MLSKSLQIVVSASMGIYLLSSAVPPFSAQSNHKALQAASAKQPQNVLDRMIDAYKKMNSLSLKVGTYYDAGLGTYIDFQKPNKVAVTFFGLNGDTRHAICDGKYIYSYKDKDKKHYVRTPAPSDREAIAHTIMASGSPAALTASILSENGRFDTRPFTSLKMERPTVFMDTPVEVVVAEFSAPGQAGTTGSFTFKIGQADHLLRDVEAKVVMDAKTQTIAETHGTKCISVNPALPSSLFAFTPPPGAQIIASLAPKEPHYKCAIKAGDLPLPLEAIDIANQKVSLEQYTGKVVLLDYWATWCAPCMREMPNVVSLRKRYQGQGFDILGISLDNSDGRKALPRFLKTNGMPWRQVCDGQGFGSPLVQGYQIEGIPFSILIGRDGKIAAIDIRGKELEAAIQEALAAK